ncbi:MAG TPA: hypothetical protein VHU90_04555 [Galbitalea sp.]|nr:hypothetical protein [Galbitalea sp.]
MTTIEIHKLFEAALEHTFYLAPNDLGLTTEELLEVGRRQGLETIIQKRGVAIMASAGVRGNRPGDRVSC